jgi:hypothetical protein
MVSQSDRNISLVLFFTFWLTYGYFFPGGGWGTNAFLDLTRAIVEEGSLFIDNYVENTGDWSKVPKGYIINKSPGVSFLGVPAYYILRLFDPNPFSSFEQATRSAHLITFFSISMLCAAGCGIFYLLLRRWLPPQRSIALTVIYALGTSNFGYATILYTQALLGALYIAVLYIVHEDQKGKIRMNRLVAAGFLLAFSVVVEPLSVLVVVIFVMFLFSRPLEIKGWFYFIVGALPAALLLLGYNYSTMGNLFTYSYKYQNPIYNYEGAFMGILQVPSLKVLYYITFHPVRGLFWISPLLILSLPGLWLLWEKDRSVTLMSTAIIGVYLLFSISFVAWHAGWSVGPRYLSPSLPFWILALCEILTLSRITRILFYFVGAVSVLLNTMITAVNIQAPMLEMTNPLIQYIIPMFRSGVLSTNNNTVLHKGVENVFSLNSVEEVWASYNLGEIIGLEGHWSLIPLAIYWVGAMFLIYQISRKNDD